MVKYFRAATRYRKSAFSEGQVPVCKDRQVLYEGVEHARNHEFLSNSSGAMARLLHQWHDAFHSRRIRQYQSLNDRISVQDVEDVYVPLCHLIHLYMKEFESLTLSKGLFLHRYVKMPPFIIGIAGSVAVGKSTTARLVQNLLSRLFPRRTVQLITTDGFCTQTRS